MDFDSGWDLVLDSDGRWAMGDMARGDDEAMDLTVGGPCHGGMRLTKRSNDVLHYVTAVGVSVAAV